MTQTLHLLTKTVVHSNVHQPLQPLLEECSVHRLERGSNTSYLYTHVHVVTRYIYSGTSLIQPEESVLIKECPYFRG